MKATRKTSTPAPDPVFRELYPVVMAFIRKFGGLVEQLEADDAPAVNDEQGKPRMRYARFGYLVRDAVWELRQAIEGGEAV